MLEKITKKYGGLQFELTRKLIPVKKIKFEDCYQPRLNDNICSRSVDIIKSMKSTGNVCFKDLPVYAIRDGYFYPIDGFGRTNVSIDRGDDEIDGYTLPVDISEKDLLWISRMANGKNTSEKNLTSRETEKSIVDLNNAGWSTEELSKSMGHTIRGIDGIIKKCSEKKELENNTSRVVYQPFKGGKDGRYPKRQVCDEMKSLYTDISLFGSNIQQRFDSLKAQILDKFNVNISVSTVRNVIDVSHQWNLSNLSKVNKRYLVFVYGTSKETARVGGSQATLIREMNMYMKNDLCVVPISNTIGGKIGCPFDSPKVTRFLEGVLV